MNLDGARFLVAGASGELGARLALGLQSRGAHVAAAGRDRERLDAVCAQLATDPVELELTDANSCESAVDAAIGILGGLDGLVIATGAVAFGRSGEVDRAAERTLLDVNARGPIDLIAAALPQLEPGGAVVGLSAVVAEFPTAGMAAYSASKAAFSAYLKALRRERRKQLEVVLDVRPGHMETGFATRALAGEPPKLPEPACAEELITGILDAVETGGRELSYDPRTRKLTLA